MNKRSFPEGFLWGASTAAHQVEGGTRNQWSAWEKANAQRLAKTAPERLSWLPNWETIAKDASDPDNYISGRGIDHYQRYTDDFRLLKQLNMNAFRFSVEWSRIEPEEGKWDEREIEHYRRYIAELRSQGIEPVMTLWHWTMPVWFADKGGFEKRRNVRCFARFVAKVADELGDGVRYVAPLNEPSAYASQSYAAGFWPPARRHLPLGLCVYYNLTRAHKQAYAAWKTRHPDARIGIAMALADIRPFRHNLIERLVARASSYVANWWFLNRIRRQLDYIGVNYYFTAYATWRFRQHNPPSPLSDLGWYMEPSGIGRVLAETWRRYSKPLIIAENGLADAEDRQRQWWLEQTLSAMKKALAAGVDLRGYLHWSLVDNFEWAFGWWPKFGLVAVDRTTQKRTIRPSAAWFAKQIKEL